MNGVTVTMCGHHNLLFTFSTPNKPPIGKSVINWVICAGSFFPQCACVQIVYELIRFCLFCIFPQVKMVPLR